MSWALGPAWGATRSGCARRRRRSGPARACGIQHLRRRGACRAPARPAFGPSRRRWLPDPQRSAEDDQARAVERSRPEEQEELRCERHAKEFNGLSAQLAVAKQHEPEYCGDPKKDGLLPAVEKIEIGPRTRHASNLRFGADDPASTRSVSALVFGGCAFRCSQGTVEAPWERMLRAGALRGNWFGRGSDWEALIAVVFVDDRHTPESPDERIDPE
jgi:hypothetical protein